MIAYLSAIKHYENEIMCIFSLKPKLLSTVFAQHWVLTLFFFFFLILFISCAAVALSCDVIQSDSSSSEAITVNCECHRVAQG